MTEQTSYEDRVARITPGLILLILIIEFAVLVALLVAFYLYLPHDRQVSIGLIGGLLPLVVPWGGALGGVTNALVGVSSHWTLFGTRRPSPQSSQWNAWYLVQLPLGAAFGTISTLIVVYLVGSLGKNAGGDIDVSPAGSATLLVIAFAVGYRQDVFRQLLARVTTILLGNAQDAPTGVLFSVAADLAFDPTAVNSNSTKQLTIHNDGQLLLRINREDLTISGADSPAFQITSYPIAAAAGSTSQVGITFSPVAAKSYSADLTIRVGTIEKHVALTGTGT